MADSICNEKLDKGGVCPAAVTYTATIGVRARWARGLSKAPQRGFLKPPRLGQNHYFSGKSQQPKMKKNCSY